MASFQIVYEIPVMIQQVIGMMSYRKPYINKSLFITYHYRQ
jgi:hypothetical protein